VIFDWVYYICGRDTTLLIVYLSAKVAFFRASPHWLNLRFGDFIIYKSLARLKVIAKIYAAEGVHIVDFQLSCREEIVLWLLGTFLAQCEQTMS
jgi:hypothetical protein